MRAADNPYGQRNDGGWCECFNCGRRFGGLRGFDEHRRDFRRDPYDWGCATDEELMSDWVLMNGDQEIMRMPRAALLRMLMLNHAYHHRGQLTVYLRALNVPVPSIYGPSADENPFANVSAKAAGAV